MHDLDQFLNFAMNNFTGLYPDRGLNYIDPKLYKSVSKDAKKEYHNGNEVLANFLLLDSWDLTPIEEPKQKFIWRSVDCCDEFNGMLMKRCPCCYDPL